MGDSILSVGLDLADETEKSIREIGGGVGQEFSSDTLQTTQAEQEQAELQELREMAQAAQEREEAEKAQEMEQSLER